MPIEHTCQSCAASLTRVAALPDPIYGLPVVVCPECGAAVVRRRHPLVIAWRTGRQTASTLWGLGWRSALVGFMILGTIGVCVMMAEVTRDITLSQLAGGLLGTGSSTAYEHFVDDNGRTSLVVFGCMAVLVGTILTAGLAHVRSRVVVWLLFLSAVCGVIALVTTLESIERLGRTGDGFLDIVHRRTFELRMIVALAAMVPIGLAGIPLGLRLRGALAKRTARRFTKKLARVRAQRANI